MISMANEVNITITAKDLTGPSFASALLKMEALRKVAKDLGKDFQNIGGISIDTNKMMSALSMLKAKLQALGIADLADVNISPGRITTQLMLLKRLIQQQGISDLLDINVNPEQLATQMEKISSLSAEIPVSFDVAPLKLPHVVQSEVIPVSYGTPTGGIGSGLDQKFNVGISSGTTAAMDALVADSYKLHSAFGMTHDDIVRLWQVMGGFAGVASMTYGFWGAIGTAAARYGGLARTAFADAVAGAIANNAVIRDQIPLFEAGTGWLAQFGFWGAAATAKVTLFGGALGRLPLIGQVAAWHVLADTVAEFVAVIVPATVALAAFGLGAAPTVNDISRAMRTAFNDTTAFGQSVYPLTDGMHKLEDAAKPYTIQLFGDALAVVGANTGKLPPIIDATGRQLEILGARATSALVSGGLGTFLKDGPKDVAMIGEVVANIFGTVGNLLKVVPGYAQILLHAVVGVTGALEALSASHIFQDILNGFLVFHGAALWLGLAASAVLYTTNAFARLLIPLGLVNANFLLFDAAQFFTGLQMIGQGVVQLIRVLFTLGAAADYAAASSWALEGAFTSISALSIVGWAALAAAGIGALVYWLVRSKDATNEMVTATQKFLGQVPVNQLGINLLIQYRDAVAAVNSAQNALDVGGGTYVKTLNDQAAAVKEAAASHGQLTVAQAKELIGTFTYVANAQRLGTVLNDNHALLPVLQKDMSNYSQVLKAAGGNTSLLAAAGITSNDILNATAQTLPGLIIQAKAAADAQNALAIGTGRQAAAANAQRNEFMQETLPALQNVTTAEDNLINVLLGGQQAFISFQQGILQMGKDAQVSGASLTGFNSQSLTLASDLYTTVIPAAQKLSDSLTQQGISQKDLTTVIATQSAEMLTYAGSNLTARDTIIAFINNALGPGTVSLQNLNKWVGQNGTSLTGMNAIVDKSTIKVGGLAGVLNNDLVAAFQASLFKASGAQTAISNMTDAIIHQGINSNAFKSARDQLIADLEKTGLSATDAKNFVNNLQGSVDRLHGKTVNVGVHASGSGTVQARESLGSVLKKLGALSFYSGGGKVPGFGGGDEWPAMLERGEAVIDKDKTKKYAWLFKQMGVPGFASGGVIGGMSGLTDWAGNNESSFINSAWPSFGNSAAGQFLQDAVSYANTLVATKQVTGPTVGGPPAAAPNQNARLAQSMYPQYASGPVWNAWNYVAMRESGWNQFATNPSSGAYGIPQALPFSKMPVAAWPAWAGGQSDPRTQIAWMWNYMASTYGGPIGAAAHEAAMNWYDNGGWLKPGLNIMMNGTGGYEHLTRDSGPGSGGGTFEVVGGSSEFEKFMAEFIRNFVRYKGGGSVQRAFGSRNK